MKHLLLLLLLFAPITLSQEGKEQPYVGRILIGDMKSGISQSTWIYVHAAAKYYKQNKPLCIILELNTPGGEVFAAQRISDVLKELDTQYGIPVIAHINNWAISAGAMLAYSCRHIVIDKDASMGAAEPIQMGGQKGPESAPEKINSAIRADFRNRAQFYDRNGDIAEAMVDKDLILVQRGEEVVRLSKEEEIIEGDQLISGKGKLLTLDGKQLLDLGVADMMLEPISLQTLSEKEKRENSFPLKKSPLSQLEVFQEYLNAPVHTFEMDWQTSFLAFLATPAISSLLVLGLLLGFYIEFTTPGFGIPGSIGLLSLFFIILSSNALEAISWLEPLLFFLGVSLLLIDLFVIPTFGIIGILGAIFVLIGLGGMLLPGLAAIEFDGETLNAAGEYVLGRLSWISGSLLVAIGFIIFMSRYLLKPELQVFKKIVLTDTELLEKGTHEMEVSPSISKEHLKVGQRARVVVPLRPAGKVVVDDVEYDAISSGSFIEKDVYVTICRIEGEKIVVEEKIV